MKVPLTWLRDYVAVDVPVEDLVERVTVSIAGVERVFRRGVVDEDGNLGLYRVGRVLEADKHPNADRLQLCRVDVGEHEPRQIVCGAWNFGEGATVAVALPGALLPDGRRLERTKLRGAVSDGMILSEHELELGTDHTGILVLTEQLEPGTPLADVLPIADVVLELEITPNRPDLLAVYGVARELAALYDAELAPPPGRDPERSEDEPVDVTIEDYEGCPRYIGRLFRDVRVGPSPAWLKARLTAAGMRPISNVVDVTNYVMHALGNPLHAFDFDTLRGGRIVVRPARRGEEFTSLDGNLRKLEPDDLVIADGERAIAFAGIMGGLDTEVRDETKAVLLEAANFEPLGILRSSERHALRTEGSGRWEKGVDPYLAPQAAALATELIVALAGARWTGDADVKRELPEPQGIRFRPERTNELVGVDLATEEQTRILSRLGFDDAGGESVTVPTWRARDVTREADLVEEVARFHLAEVPFTLPRGQAGTLTRDQRLRRVVEEVLVGCGCSEAYTSSLVAEDPAPDALRLPVPLSAEQAVLRTTLLAGLVQSVMLNLDSGNERIALFEIARVYLLSGAPRPDEHWHVGCVAEGGFARAKGILETLYGTLHVPLGIERAQAGFLHPGKAAKLDAGWVGELHPALLEGEWGAFELDFATLSSGIPERLVYEDVITYPAVRQDLAFVVEEKVLAGELISAAHQAAGPELREARVFDVYRGEPIPARRKSIALRVAFQSPERTLSDEDARALRERIVTALAERFGAELRA
ncbi:MAG: phenylalanine--tRNA ligase subunit beta [Gaiellaceae bacterium]